MIRIYFSHSRIKEEKKSFYTTRIKSLCHATFTVYQKPSYPPWYLKYAITGVIRGKSKRSQDFFVTWRKSRGRKSYTA